MRLTAAGIGDKILRLKGAIDVPIYNAQILAIDAAQARRYAGLNRAADFGEKNIRDACEEALLLSKVRGAWEVYDYDDAEHIVKSSPPIEIVGRSIVKHLDGCERVVCLAVTVGSEIEREVTAKFARGEYLASVLLDAAATAAVEQAADVMEKNFAAMFARDGFKMRWRFSPGYGDWNLTEQPKIFAISGAERIGLRLTEAMMLEPRKSVTAIIGLEKISADKISASKNFPAVQKCAVCSRNDCPARNITC